MRPPRVALALGLALALPAVAGGCTLNFDRFTPTDDVAVSLPDATATGDIAVARDGAVFEPPGTCPSPRSIPAEGGTVMLTLRAEYAQHPFPCRSMARPSQYFTWVSPRAGRADIQAVGLPTGTGTGTAVDVMLDMRTDECPDGGEVECNDDSTPPGSNGARLQPTVMSGRVYYVIVGAYSPTPMPGAIRLTVVPPP